MVPKNASLSSQIGQLLEEFAGRFGDLSSASDLFPADLFDQWSAQLCAMPYRHTPEQYEDYHGSNTLV